MMTTTEGALVVSVDRKAQELRNDVLGAVHRFIQRRPEVDWTRILEGLWEACAVVETAAETEIYGSMKANALLPGTRIIKTESTTTGEAV